MDINEHIGNNRQITEKIVGIHIKLLTSQLGALNYYIWVIIDAKT